MRLLREIFILLGVILLGAIGTAAYVLSFAFKVLSVVLAGVAIMSAAADRSTRRGNRLSAFYRARGRGSGLRL